MEISLKPLLAYFVLYCFYFSRNAQCTERYSIPSKSLGCDRDIIVHLPPDYPEEGKEYPVVYALDGEYTVPAVSGITDFGQVFGKNPKCIVVGIPQNYMNEETGKWQRWLDCDYIAKTGKLEGTGHQFKEFISDDLIPYISSKYSTAPHKTILGHSFTANYINYFLLDDNPVFNSFVAMSPYYNEPLLDSLALRLPQLEAVTQYFVCAGSQDLKGHIKSVNAFDKRFRNSTPGQFKYQKYNTKNNQATHQTIVSVAMPDAIKHSFKQWQVLNYEVSFKELKRTKNLTNLIVSRYEVIAKQFSDTMPVRIGDIFLISDAITKQKDWPELHKLCQAFYQPVTKRHSSLLLIGVLL